MANVVGVFTPGENKYACSLAIAASVGLFHGHQMRKVTSGQLPIVSFCKNKFFLNILYIRLD